ncbi:hypothetical protein ARMSODRAFT_1008220 [Armillaria solidipes]|uniref:Uncharacterized protein n=1 Tax=Armillaria solidipes TaxID=1076256 RepID=A0A2H3B6C6_9AGAR|nr:hypothetical protein ARMSODRAFT_1008220 [Armillaria solidipes]
MATTGGPPPDLSQNDKTVIFNALDMTLNGLILEGFLQGVYTGVIAVTLWTMFRSPRQHGTFLCTIIIMLYVLMTISFVMDWLFYHRAFIGHGYNYYNNSPWWLAYYLIDSISGGITTILVDITVIWRCWMLWDRQWQVALIPIMCALVETDHRTDVPGATRGSQVNIQL